MSSPTLTPAPDARPRQAFRVDGMDCADCAARVERTVARVPGVTAVSVSLIGGRMAVDGAADPGLIRERVVQLGYGVADERSAAPVERPADDRGAVARARRHWLRGSDRITAIATALLAVAVLADLVLGVPAGVVVALYVAPVLVGGPAIARTGLVGSWASRSPDMNLLMTIAVLGAAAIGAWAEAALVVVLFSIGEALERRAVGRARRELESLVALTPETARVLVSGACDDGCVHEREEQRPVRDVRTGDRIVVRPGDRVPTDGTIVEGRSSLNQAAITGESVPVDREPGDAVFAGTINGEGRLVVAVTAAPGDTTLDRIGRLVAEAQAQRSPSERWVTRFARIYTPIVIGLAVAVAVIPTVTGLLPFDEAFYAALALLILACPCALVLSTPVSIVSALGRASAAGVLVKGGAHLERAADVRVVAFDKTGTLTAGTPTVTRTIAFEGDSGELLRLAAAVEQGSAHPLATAIVAAARAADPRPLPRVDDARSLTGLGAGGVVEGRTVRVGSPRLLGDPTEAAAIADELRRSGATVVLVEADGRTVGALGLADRPRASSREAIAGLAALGVERTVLLTGDHPQTARAVAAEIGVDEVRADLLPADKADAVARLGGGVAMVGDGVNDAPALARADLGLAMGGAGSDTAIEVADVALLGDDPRKVAGLIGLARWTRSVVRQNIAFSLGTKLVAAGFLLFGALPLWAAVGVDVGASLIVVANGLRLVRRRPLGPAGRLPLLSGS